MIGSYLLTDEYLILQTMWSFEESERDSEHLDSKDCFTLISTMFRGKSRKNSAKRCPRFSISNDHHGSLEILSDNISSNVAYPTHSEFPITESSLPPGSPISPRVNNFNLDMKILALSRSDNPFLSQQIERSNLLTIDFDTETDTPSTPILSIDNKKRKTAKKPTSSSTRGSSCHMDPHSNDQDNDTHFHDILIRSPPPHFPKDACQFLFTESYDCNI